MDNSRALELAVGGFVAAGIVAVLVLALQMSNLTQVRVDDAYTLTAEFDNIGGLTVRSPVKLSGVTIGRVDAIAIDPKTFRAVASLRIDGRYRNLPQDTFASIYTAGLLGEQFIELAPGGEERFLADGDRIAMTQSAVVLEKIISQFLYDKAAE
ncbi:MAG: outer membrane lipid asymmetry maintenance protein MlaD [Halothiobacillaceae bacterium]|jgi:phospholipid/cholesterol/gamma-HCH transport system substrate-binding protein|nr:outer membrane lipid asymmetry maintenance protein MlaD [Halothiobacillaceae bacterium]